MITPNLTSLQLTWTTPLVTNGIIIAYEVSVEEEGTKMNTTDVSTTHTLMGLRPQTTYTVTVRAYTIAGPGEERSVSVSTTTNTTSGIQ